MKKLKSKNKKKRKKKINNLYILAVKNDKEQVKYLIPSHDYSWLQVEGMELAKAVKGSWLIFRLFRPGIEIDGGSLKAEFRRVPNEQKSRGE